jgi:hypothetical protein
MQIPELPKDHPGNRFVAGEFVTRGINLCLMCVHYRKDKKCEAFPDGIPHDIWVLKVLHKKPYPGDKGITFKPLPEHDNSNEALGIK